MMLEPLEPLRLHRINEYFWLLFPTKEFAYVASMDRLKACSCCMWPISVAHAWANHWSKEFNCTVSFLSEGDIIMVAEVSGERAQAINQDGKSGWINFPFEEQWTAGAIVKASYDL